MTTSLGKGLTLLDVLAGEQEALGLTAVARRAELPKSTAHRLLASLTDAGLVSRLQDGRYALGLRLFELGSRVAAGLEVRDLARPELRRLRDATGETAHLGVALDDSVVYVEKVESARTVRMASRLGGRNPLHCTALGKALLAFGPEQLRERAMAGPLERRTRRTLVDHGLLAAELDSVRRRGWAVDDEESELELRCIGAPIVDATGLAIAAISVSGPSSRVTKAGLRRLGTAVAQSARRISIDLGCAREAA